jgi:hypothetical protein
MREPVAVVNASIGIIEATMSLAVGFGLSLDTKQVALLMALVVAIGNLIQTLWARGQVTPVADPRDNNGGQLIAESGSTWQRPALGGNLPTADPSRVR